MNETLISWPKRLLGETQVRLLSMLRRSQRSISDLAATLKLTDNAVRGHVAALGRDGLVADVGAVRDTGGKPARLYALTPAGEELFPKAYALVLSELVQEIGRTQGRERALELLRSVGARAGARRATTLSATDVKGRVEAAADMLRGLGGDVDVLPEGGGWKLQGYGCPFSAVTATHSELCAMARALVQEVTGQPVEECCQRGARPRCAFSIAPPPDHRRK